ncbi:MAG TPA: choice-of-anchor Q domain-containing protein, partial [Saprospiraceae bacterium]|nr:choice-of-anchor Q domain-containing protein [Saprospiraceae bacterium]
MKKSEFFISANSSRVFTFFLFFLFCAGRLSAATWYVKPTGSDAASGNSWANAYQTLTKALQSAASGDQIWVASGTYKPTTGTDRTISFNMKTGVTILGGFPATGNPVLADRDWETHVTTLSGDIGTAGDNSDNSYHVVSNFNVGISAVLDGFTLTAGSSNSDGGGMYCISSSPRIENCRFVSNGAVRFGAGLFCGQNSNAVLNNCFFYSNYAGSIGGGISSQESNLTISNTVFSGNSGTSGAGLCIQDAPANVTNCVFSGNLAGNLGGGMLTWNAASSVTNCSFSGNLSSSNTGGLVNYGTTSAILRNCIFWGNKGSGVTNVGGGTAIVTYSIVQGGYAGAGNLNVDPMFVEQPPIEHGLSGDLRLQACSPAINKGSDAAVPAGVTTDLDGNNRFYGTVDMGAYEYQSNAPPPVAACKNITVQLDATGNVSVPASAADNGSTGCGSLTFYLSQTNFNCSKVGVNNLLFVVSDNNFHSASCAVTVTVQDNTVPTAACKNASLQLDASGNASLAASAINNGSADACGIASLALSKTAFDCSNTGVNTVILSATDNSGNSATCSATVTVQDNIAPTAVCKDATVQLDATGNVTVPASAVNNGSADACGIASLVLNQATFNCSNVGANTVTLTVTDNHGKTATCTSTVTVQDNTLPTAICKNATVQLDATGNVTVPASAVDNGSTDACGIAALTLSKTNFNCSNVGNLLVSLEVRDNNGNKAYCSATLTVQDNIAPTALCKNATIQLDAAGNATLTTAAINNGSADACGIASLVLSKTAFDCSNTGANTVTLTVTDNNGKSATCSATVTVQDNVAPTAVCQNTTLQLD